MTKQNKFDQTSIEDRIGGEKWKKEMEESNKRLDRKYRIAKRNMWKQLTEKQIMRELKDLHLHEYNDALQMIPELKQIEDKFQRLKKLLYISPISHHGIRDGILEQMEILMGNQKMRRTYGDIYMSKYVPQHSDEDWVLMEQGTWEETNKLVFGKKD